MLSGNDTHAVPFLYLSYVDPAYLTNLSHELRNYPALRARTHIYGQRRLVVYLSLRLLGTETLFLLSLSPNLER